MLALAYFQRSTIRHDPFVGLDFIHSTLYDKNNQCLLLDSTLELVGTDTSVLALVPLPALPFFHFNSLLLSPYLLLLGECVFSSVCLMRLPSGGLPFISWL
jgi:hypothetical protein